MQAQDAAVAVHGHLVPVDAVRLGDRAPRLPVGRQAAGVGEVRVGLGLRDGRAAGGQDGQSGQRQQLPNHGVFPGTQPRHRPAPASQHFSGQTQPPQAEHFLRCDRPCSTARAKAASRPGRGPPQLSGGLGVTHEPPEDLPRLAEEPLRRAQAEAFRRAQPAGAAAVAEEPELIDALGGGVLVPAGEGGRRVCHALIKRFCGPAAIDGLHEIHPDGSR